MKDPRYNTKTIDELAKLLTPEEREQLSELIEECKNTEPRNKIYKINMKLQTVKRNRYISTKCNHITNNCLKPIGNCIDEYSIIMAVLEKPKNTLQ